MSNSAPGSRCAVEARRPALAMESTMPNRLPSSICGLLLTLLLAATTAWLRSADPAPKQVNGFLPGLPRGGSVASSRQGDPGPALSFGEESAQRVAWFNAAGFRPGNEFRHIHPPVCRLAVVDPALRLLQSFAQLPLGQPSFFAQATKEGRHKDGRTGRVALWWPLGRIIKAQFLDTSLSHG